MAPPLRERDTIGAPADAVWKVRSKFFLHMCTVCSTFGTQANGLIGELELQ